MAEDINDIGLLLDFQDDRNYDKILYCSEKKNEEKSTVQSRE